MFNENTHMGTLGEIRIVKSARSTCSKRDFSGKRVQLTPVCFITSKIPNYHYIMHYHTHGGYNMRLNIAIYLAKVSWPLYFYIHWMNCVVANAKNAFPQFNIRYVTKIKRSQNVVLLDDEPLVSHSHPWTWNRTMGIP